jgi:hypothetical protein
MSATATAEVIVAVRAQFGPDFVPARVTAEEQVRTVVDTHLGTMDAERIVTLGRLINQHGKLGRERYDRFTPGFTGVIMSKLGSDPSTFNRILLAMRERKTIDAEACATWPG